MSVKGFVVGGVQYNAAMASAVDQDRLLSLLAGPLIERAMHAAREGLDMEEQVVLAMMLSMPQSTKVQVAEILLTRCVVNGTERAVTVKDFGGQMVNYNRLLAQLLLWNLSDFFGWLPSALESEKTAAASDPL